MSLTIHGYKYSIYTWIVRACLYQKGIQCHYEEIDPFADEVSPDYLMLNPFGNVPVLDHDGLVLFETRAITAYLNDAFEGPELRPQGPKARARSEQVISILDAYGYRPMIRQVYANRVFAPAFGETVNEQEILDGLERSELVLGALEQIVSESDIGPPDQTRLSDIHLIPMLSFLAEAKEGAEMLEEFPDLNARWMKLRDRKCFAETRQALPRS